MTWVNILASVVALLLFSLIPAVQARRRGYALGTWLAAGVLLANPIFLMIILGVVPHAARQQLRERFRQELDAKLASAAPPKAVPVVSVVERSLGDERTVAPGERSLGDELTR